MAPRLSPLLADALKNIAAGGKETRRAVLSELGALRLVTFEIAHSKVRSVDITDRGVQVLKGMEK